MQDQQHWLAITDEHVSMDELEVELGRRVDKRRLELGEVRFEESNFAPLSTFPEPPPNQNQYPALYYHLRRANQVDLERVGPLLDDNVETSSSFLSRLVWPIRRRFHELVMFYVNHALQDESKLDSHIVSTLNEMTRVIQAQQEEIENLKAEVHLLEREQQ